MYSLPLFERGTPPSTVYVIDPAIGTTTMKLSDKITAHGSAYPFYTFEFFPPRTDQVGSMH